jgi:hypothetical protein
VSYAVYLEPRHSVPQSVAYRWDIDTEILSVRVTTPSAESAPDVVEVTGTDGSWLLLDLADGAIHGLEVAVWPTDIHTTALRRPADVEHVRAHMTSADRAIGATEGDRPVELAVERDAEGRTVHLTVGPSRETRTVQLAQSLLLDVDPLDEIAGIWLLDVPPLPLRRPLA